MISLVQRRLKSLRLDAFLFITSEVVRSPFARRVSGFSGSDASVLVTRDEAHIFTDARYALQVTEECSGFVTHIANKTLNALASFLTRKEITTVGIDSGRMTIQVLSRLQKKAPKVRFVPAKDTFLESLRIIKSPVERMLTAAAARIASEACEHVLKKGLADRQEWSIAADMEHEFRMNGAERPSFDTIVASGARSALPHGKATEKVIARGDLVVLDYGCVYEGYCSDETVTCVVGAPTPEQRRIHEAVRDAHDAAIDALKPGVACSEVDRVARKTIEKAGYGNRFIHGLGHGVGLEVHEPPRISPLGRGTLEEGMIFTIEPGIYIEGFGGVRLESLVCMRRTGPVILSGMSKELHITQ